ncbi:hypothetical protein P9853_00460 [Geobacillus stearothermophilus]|uniref:RNA polymerase factor sigma-54 n=1 Tax=Geobacillus TaxID=129337 RepID=UPI001E5722BA|nr:MULTISPECIES: hypothetical protein [Geobacillus]MED3664022.1 hypothetical protein [Geobacillus stearothermophilus]MED3721248.1 hypothetical protein [Geobacillus stearothermophilus]MED3723904.1 hypothetical protein [Geobacillus stearothermophilus]MED3729778.1 hypothetical protein [Geobacillus stearothermophilus]MED3732424.1 hypothetical protein [Geobacillus stearothermophilus]
MNVFLSATSWRKRSRWLSSAQVKAIIQELIAAEDRQTPLSGQQLADLLHGRYGIAISLRTVAKYREQLRIPSSAKRKQYTGA